MQVLSLSLIIPFALFASLVIALTILASPLFAAVAFVIAFGVFLAWRGHSRAEHTSGRGRKARVPSTEEASADPAEDPGPTTATGRRLN